VAVFGKLVCTKGETIHKTIQKHGKHKVENIERILKNIGRIIKKMTEAYSNEATYCTVHTAT
jgi:hypothetical protein